MAAKEGQCERECAWGALQDLQVAVYSESSLNRVLAEKLSTVNRFFACEISAPTRDRHHRQRKSAFAKGRICGVRMRPPGDAQIANCWRVSHYFAFAVIAARAMLSHRIASNPKLFPHFPLCRSRAISAALPRVQTAQGEFCE